MSNPFDLIDARLSTIEDLPVNLNQVVIPTKKNNLEQRFNLNQLVVYNPLKRTKPTFYRCGSNGNIPYHKYASNWLIFLKSEIDNWIKEGKAKTALEINNENFDLLSKKK